MIVDSEIFTFTDSAPAAVEALQREMAAALADGQTRVTLDLDPIPTLDIAGIRGLITLLRRVREAGGEIALRTSRADICRTLAVTGLDRVFSVDSCRSGPEVAA
ncbi:MAG: STAS domain-containing protein [Vulcanimicrobiaceae bacterium]